MNTASCPRCGAELEGAWRYCPFCGRRATLAVAVPFRRRIWWRVLVAGSLIFLIVRNLYAASGNPNLAPTLVLVGAFLVPITYVIYLYETEALYEVSLMTLGQAFLVGGTVGVIAAQVLEQQLTDARGLLGILGVAASEEIAKPLGVLWLGRRREFPTARHGFLLGAAAGMGFAAFESMGYGFSSLVASRGNLDILGQVLFARGLISPLGHATWTALVVGTYWRDGRRISRGVLVALAVATGLHAAWDWSAAHVPIDVGLPAFEIRGPFAAVSIPELNLPLGTLIVGAIGVWWVRRASRPRAS